MNKELNSGSTSLSSSSNLMITFWPISLPLSSSLHKPIMLCNVVEEVSGALTGARGNVAEEIPGALAGACCNVAEEVPGALAGVHYNAAEEVPGVLAGACCNVVEGVPGALARAYCCCSCCKLKCPAFCFPSSSSAVASPPHCCCCCCYCCFHLCRHHLIW